MNKKLILLLVFVMPLINFGQDYSALWKGYFSYNNIVDVTQSSTKIYAAADNAIFSYDITTQEIEELNTIKGLSGESITTIHYSEAYQLMLIGYENGLIEVAFDNDTEILSVVDIIEKTTIQPSSKRINHFNEVNELVYISTSFGISVYNLERLEFGDSYFIGDLGTHVEVRQTTIHQGHIYAACFNNAGVKKAAIDNPNLIDYQEWQTLITGNWEGIEAINNQLYATRNNRSIYSVVNDVFNVLTAYPNTVLDIRAVANALIITTRNNVYIYDSMFSLQSQITTNSEFSTRFNSATINDSYAYIGTKDFGVLRTSLTSSGIFDEIHPDGPLLNTPFSLAVSNNDLWVTFGAYDITLNPWPLSLHGYSRYTDESWTHTPFDDVFGATDLNNISVNPSNPNQIFISSFHSGLLEVNDGMPSILYNTTNSGLESLIDPRAPNSIDIRVGPTRFDNNGILWSMTSRVESPLKAYNPSSNSWQSYSFSNIITNALDDDLGFRDLVIDNSTGIKWTGGSKAGLIGFTENGGSPQLKNIKEETNNMPSTYVTALIQDKRNQLWIGTERGLRVLYNTSDFFENDNVQVSEIVILDDGIPQELLFEQFISDIKVDGSNNKWIGTNDSGIFYFSSDGQKTIYHFTTQNSPLPSNSILDIAIDEANGTVYIATSRGLVSFRSGSSSPTLNLENAFVYPNPIRPTFNIVEEKVKIKDVSENVNIKITDIEGNLVAEAQSRKNLRHRGYNLEIDGGTAYWNGKNLANNIVASGVYLIMLSDLDTLETRVLKIMVVR